MYKKILVAVDESDISIQALHEAIKLAKSLQAKLRIIHVLDEFYVDYVGLGIDYVRLEKSVKEYGQKILANMEDIARKAGIDFDSKLIELKTDHRIPEQIIAATKAWPADLLVIGTHGRRGIHHFLLGSVAEGVARIAKTPVLLVRGTSSST